MPGGHWRRDETTGLDRRPCSASAQERRRDILTVDLGLQSASNAGQVVGASLGCETAGTGGIIGFGLRAQGESQRVGGSLASLPRPCVWVDLKADVSRARTHGRLPVSLKEISHDRGWLGVASIHHRRFIYQLDEALVVGQSNGRAAVGSSGYRGTWLGTAATGKKPCRGKQDRKSALLHN